MTRRKIIACAMTGKWELLEKYTGLQPPKITKAKRDELSRFFLHALYLATEHEKEIARAKLECE